MHHSLLRESVKSTDSGSVTEVNLFVPPVPRHKSYKGTSTKLRSRNTRTHAWPSAHDQRGSADHQRPAFFPAVAELAKRGLLSPETWQCNRPRISLKTSIDVPMLGDTIEQNGDGLLEESHMPVGWPLHIDGAVRQPCIHRDTTLQELDDLLSEYDMKRDLGEINRKAPQWSHKAVWNKWYMELKAGHTLSQIWINARQTLHKRRHGQMKSGTAIYAV